MGQTTTLRGDVGGTAPVLHAGGLQFTPLHPQLKGSWLAGDLQSFSLPPFPPPYINFIIFLPCFLSIICFSTRLSLEESHLLGMTQMPAGPPADLLCYPVFSPWSSLLLVLENMEIPPPCPISSFLLLRTWLDQRVKNVICERI